MANFLTNLFSAGASSLVNAVGDAIDKNVTSDEERKDLENEIEKAKLNYEVEMKSLGINETKAYLSDTASARENQSRVQESSEAGFLAKNVHPILALVIFLLNSLLVATLHRQKDFNFFAHFLLLASLVFTLLLNLVLLFIYLINFR